MSELTKLKKQARGLYLEATRGTNLGCGIALAEYIQGYPRSIAQSKFSEVWAKVRELEPSAPLDPFKSED
jgi:hypothetical protein